MGTASEVRQVGVSGGLIELEVYGSGPPLVLLHGWAMDRRIWKPQVDSLSRYFQLIIPDRRGFGRSGAPPNLALEADDLVVIRRVLGLPPVACLAMSQAGRVALQFALSHPESVWGLVLQGVPLDGFHPEEREDEAVPLESYSALTRTGQAHRMKALWRAHPLMKLPAGRDWGVDPLIEAYDGRDLTGASSPPLKSMADHLMDIWTPALVVTGEHDTPWRQLVGDAIAYGLCNARRAVVEAGHHLCNVTNPDEFNSLVTRFLLSVKDAAKVPASGAAA